MNIQNVLLNIEFLLIVIVVLLVVIAANIRGIAKRTRETFPTAKEQDYDWALKDPMGHWEAHKKKPKGPKAPLSARLRHLMSRKISYQKEKE